MSNWSKSAFYGGIYTKTQPQTNCLQCDAKISCKYYKFANQLKNYQEILKAGWEKSKNLSRTTGTFGQLYRHTQTKVQAKWPVVRGLYLSIKDNLKIHLTKKQELYWPLLISAVLLLLVLVSKIAFAGSLASPNNFPIEDSSKFNLIGFEKKTASGKICSKDEKADSRIEKVAEASDNKKEELKNEIASVVKNTPMAAMIDSISEKPRPVAAFIVGIAMKESKFGVYSPKKDRQDCYNYWGYKGRENVTAGGYSCFSSPEHAVEVVGGKIESLVDRGVKNPAQMISWKCGRSCAGHGQANVQKWISDVAIYFNRINS